jgi:hypothetical protein
MFKLFVLEIDEFSMLLRAEGYFLVVGVGVIDRYSFEINRFNSSTF